MTLNEAIFQRGYWQFQSYPAISQTTVSTNFEARSSARQSLPSSSFVPFWLRSLLASPAGYPYP